MSHSYIQPKIMLIICSIALLISPIANAVPNQLDIVLFDAPVGDTNGLDDMTPTDGINGQVTAALGGTLGVVAIDALGNPDSTASGTVIVDLRGKHTGQFISFSTPMANGAATLSIPDTLQIADQYWIEATLSGFSLSSADSFGEGDTLTVVGGATSGLMVSSPKQAISNQNIPGAGATVRISAVDQFGNLTTNEGGKMVILTDVGGFVTPPAQTFAANRQWIDMKIGGDGIPLDTSVFVPGELTLTAAFANLDTLTDDTLSLQVYSEHLVASYTDDFGNTPRAADNTVFAAFNVITSANTTIPSATIDHQVKNTGATAHRTIETSVGATVNNNRALLALTKATGDIRLAGDERYRISRNGLGDALIEGDEVGDIVATSAASVVYYDANNALTDVVPTTQQGSVNQVQILASRLLAMDEFGNRLSVADALGNRVSVENIVSAAGATLFLNPTAGLVAGGEGTAALTGGPDTDTITISFVDDLPDIVLNAVKQLGDEPLLGSGMTAPATFAVTQATVNCTLPPGCIFVEAGLGDAVFKGGVAVNNGPRAVTIGVTNAAAQQSDSFSIRGSIDIPPAHEGMPGRIQVFAAYTDPVGNTFYFQVLGSIHQGGSVLPWDTNTLTAGAFRAIDAFADVESIDIFSGSLAGLPGTLLFVMAYQVGEEFDTSTVTYFHGAQIIQVVIDE